MWKQWRENALQKAVVFVMQRAEEDSVVSLMKCITWDKGKNPHVFSAQW